MSLDALAQLGEFIGGVVVILSLIYLAYEIRQNTKTLRAENYGRALDRIAAIQGRLASESELAKIIGRGVLDTRQLDTKQRVQFTWTFYEMFSAFEFMFHQHENGALPSEVWERWSETLRWWLALPGVELWWRSKPAPFTSSFSRFVEGRIAASDRDETAVTERFQRFLRGEAGSEGGSKAEDDPTEAVGGPT